MCLVTRRLLVPVINMFMLLSRLACPFCNAQTRQFLRVIHQAQFSSMSPLWKALYFMFVMERSVGHKMEAMTDFILHQSNPPCRDVNTNNEFKPCTLTNQEDYNRFRYGNSDCLATSGQMMPSCKDGSNNMTCLALSLTPVKKMCACDAVKGDLNTGIMWNDNWENITESGSVMKRSLCDVQAGWCLDAMFKMGLIDLVKRYAPLDSHITVSSVYSNRFRKEEVRLGSYGAKCAWAKADSDTSPWVKFDLSQSRVAVGVKIGKRCDDTYDEQYVTSFHVSTSVDDVTWLYIGTDVQAVYEGIIATWWFGREVSARYWRIEPVTSHDYPSMQAEFIGYI